MWRKLIIIVIIIIIIIIRLPTQHKHLSESLSMVINPSDHVIPFTCVGGERIEATNRHHRHLPLHKYRSCSRGVIGARNGDDIIIP